MVVTVSQNAELLNPEWLFSFTHIFSKQQVNFVLPNLSVHQKRYDEFEFTEGTGVGQISFPYEGQYTYRILEQVAQIPTNTNPSLAYNTVEWGTALLMATTGETTNDYYVEYISNNEDNSNYIFAPDELNPQVSPSVTPSATATPAVTSSPTPTLTVSSTNTPTPTPSITPTLTPTVTSTITPTITQTPSVTPTITSSATPTMTPTPSSTPAPFDSDAAAYLASVLSNGGTLDSTMSAATNTLFTNLKSNGIYSNLIAFYPILGGVANSHKLNGNLNTSYDLSYNGGWTHNSAGQKPNGTDAYANTNYSFPTDAYSNSFGIYVTTSATTNSYEIDCGVEKGGNYWHLAAYWNATNDSRYFNIDRAGNFTNTTNGGNYHNVRTSQSLVEILRNGIVVASETNPAASGVNSSPYGLYLGALNSSGTANFNSTKNEIFAYIASGMTSATTITLDTLINNFQTSLGRNTY